MCGILDDVGSFVKDTVGEITSHPLQAAGAALGIPGYDPLIGGLFNSGQGGALINPEGDFTPGAWQDMAQAHPGDSGVLGTMEGVNGVADKIAPALAGQFYGGALSGASGAGDFAGAGESGAGAFTTGLESSASDLGGLESSLGGASLSGVGAGTGTALGSGVAQGLGAGGLGVAGPSSLAGLTASTGATGGSLLGGSTTGTGLSGYQGGAQMPTGTVGTDGGAISAEGAQAAPPTGGGASMGTGSPMGFDQAAAQSGPAAGDQSLTSMFGQTPTPSAANPLGTTGSGAPMGYGGAGGQTGDLGTVGGEAAAPSQYANGGWTQNIGGSGLNLNDVMNLGKTAQSFWQQHQASQNAKNYQNSIASIYSPTGAYAQQMQQTLARQDAAAGRNSQGGTRAVQLAAALAGDQSRAMTSSPYSQAANNNNGTQVLNGLFNTFASPQGVASAGRLGSAAFNGLSSLFGG